ncbi:hypothetical protein D3C85_233960 [compost metagenome]
MFQVVDKGAIKEKQRKLKELGLYEGKVDGIWGPLSQAAWDKSQGAKVVYPDFDKTRIIWATKVSREFIIKVRDIAIKLQMPTEGANWLMACMAFETGETFSPTIKNGAGAPYYGLIQFGAAAAKDSGTTLDALLKMTAEEQLEYVYRFFKPYTGKLKTLSDIYMRILWPAAVGKPEDYVIFDQKVRPTAYVQNKGLDINKDGLVTKAECAAKVQEKYVRGLKFVA